MSYNDPILIHFRQDELAAELEELESAELEEELLQPITAAPIQAPARGEPIRPPLRRQQIAEMDELVSLQAELAL